MKLIQYFQKKFFLCHSHLYIINEDIIIVMGKEFNKLKLIAIS